ncbi:hypothetical protein RF55_21884 [Lasius niger]|uniref:Uncharacterized protein n=1 Tax=Lasius niger TaxID=67767 RepID=A0A0J7JXK1_LASNI|nr:hypothetical protein RF55_21884 [Lasius niger]
MESREESEKREWRKKKRGKWKEKGEKVEVSKRREVSQRGKGEEEEWVVGFWNVAGVKNKEEGFWKEIRVWDVIVMVETWVDGKMWDKVKSRLPRGFRWEKQLAKRRSKKGRPIKRMIVGVREELSDIMIKEIKEREEGVMIANVRMGEESWRIVGVCINGDIE